MCPLLLLKSEHQAFVLIRRNTDEHYGGYNLFQNTDLNRNVQVKFKQNVDLVVICHIFFTFPSSLKSYFARRLLDQWFRTKEGDQAGSNQPPAHDLVNWTNPSACVMITKHMVKEKLYSG